MAVASRFDLGSGPLSVVSRLATTRKAHLLLLVVVVVPWLTSLAAPGLLLLAATEDGLIESIGALFYFLAGASFLAAALASRRRGLMPTLVLSGLAGIFLLSFGEEISWGQRLFDWGTPSAIAAQNVQGETNLHNVGLFNCNMGCSGTLILRDFEGNLVFDVRRLFHLGLVGLLVVVPIVTAASRHARRLATALAVPIAPPLVTVLMLAVFALSRVAFVTQPVAEQWAAKELMEASWGVLAAALALAALAAARASSRGAPLSD